MTNSLSDFKNQILSNTTLENSEKIRLATKPFPKYLWRALAKESDDVLLFDILFDATDIEQGKLFSDLVPYDKSYVELLKKYIVNHPFINSTKVHIAPLKALLQAFENF